MKVLYDALALHPILVDAKGDGITFSKEQLEKYGEGLSNKCLTVNHAALPSRVFRDHPFAKVLPYPENRTLQFKYDNRYNGLFGTLEIEDMTTDLLIHRGLIKNLSVETIHYWDKSIEFTGLALLTDDLPPRDPAARIIRESRSVIF